MSKTDKNIRWSREHSRDPYSALAASDAYCALQLEQGPDPSFGRRAVKPPLPTGLQDALKRPSPVSDPDDQRTVRDLAGRRFRFLSE